MIEVERKFIPDGDPSSWPLEVLAASAVEIDQGYLTAEGAAPEVRIRKAREIELDSARFATPVPLRSAAGGVTTVRKLAVKGIIQTTESAGVSRHEIETTLTGAQFEQAWGLVLGSLRKIRTSYSFRTSDGEFLELSIDSFRDRLRGLSLVEIEFPDYRASQEFAPLPYLATEVTHDPRYRNGHLAFADAVPSHHS